MYKILSSLLMAALCVSGSANAHIIEEIVKSPVGSSVALADPAATPKPHYAEPKVMAFPGRKIGISTHNGEASFDYPWAHRETTYELHYADALFLARSILSLAISAGDVSADIDPDKFYHGVSAFHYSTDQLCQWLNAAPTLTRSEAALVQLLKADGVLRQQEDKWVPGKNITNVLGCAPGKQRSFAQNLRHERLHVFWDRSERFREGYIKAWHNLSAKEQAAARKKLKQYNPDNEAQLIEEWAVYQAEQEALPTAD